jgi:hypothetical protein
MKALLVSFVLASGALGSAPGSFQSAAQSAAQSAVMSAVSPHPALYSFADVYRLTVAGAGGAALADTAPDAPIRVAVAQAPGAEARFSVATVPPPDKWILLLAGLALAGWVAHRRLVHAL